MRKRILSLTALGIAAVALAGCHDGIYGDGYGYGSGYGYGGYSSYGVSYTYTDYGHGHKGHHHGRHGHHGHHGHHGSGGYGDCDY